MSTLVAFVAGYFVLLFTLSLAVRAQRVRLRALANELLCLNLRPQQRHAVMAVVNTAYSMRSAPLNLLGTTIAIMTPSVRFDRSAREWARENPEIIGDPRWSELFELYYASIAAINPIFGALLYVARLVFRAKAYLFVVRHYRPTKHEMADLSVQPKIEVRPKIAEMEIFGEVKATVTA